MSTHDPKQPLLLHPLPKVAKAAAAPPATNPEEMLPAPIQVKIKLISKKSIEEVAEVLDFGNDR